MSDTPPAFLDSLTRRINTAIDSNGGIAPEYFEVSSEDYRELLEALPAHKRFCTERVDRPNLIWCGIPVVPNV